MGGLLSQIYLLLDHFDNHRQKDRQTLRDRQTDRDIEEEARVNCLYTRRFPLANLSPKICIL